jgi:transposase-like protein
MPRATVVRRWSPAWKRSAEFEAAHPGMSSRDVANAIGVDQKTVINARKRSGEERSSPEYDDRPTIDRPPKGALWDDQSDKHIGNRAARRTPAGEEKVEMRRAGRTEKGGLTQFGWVEEYERFWRQVKTRSRDTVSPGSIPCLTLGTANPA